MTDLDKRNDAANLLCISRDATPETVNQAYMTRFEQMLNFDTLRTESERQLYDARLRMLHPENRQWLATLKLLLIGKNVKDNHSFQTLLKIIRSNVKDSGVEFLLDEVGYLAEKLSRKVNLIKILCAYEIVATLGVGAVKNATLIIALLFSQLGAGIILGFTMAEADKCERELKAVMEAWKNFKSK